MKKMIIFLSALSLLASSPFVMADASEKSQAASEQMTGSVQSTVGSAIGNKKMEREGKNKKLKGDLRSTKEDVKDKVKETLE